ncbi:MAG: hypothetical protein AVDCRST_MAG37-466 [uncultured Rubrobacteraceae bacterium]|uniref:Uncharacterized protein n=1 Tax=uncultured Rubrobacteraceae bacterium TaxID=349277 RepID=A0A6J4Q0W8_9ACTN|nr:MAG: hypothetical protein AVDCRST_MAG37-466 [uncultured Rubrobacteraceae bacterium]
MEVSSLIELVRRIVCASGYLREDPSGLRVSASCEVAL